MAKIYKNAEIYMTTCSHPDFKYVKYIGLDTKKDPNYIGSSVVLKWLVGLIGKSHFHKEILETITGDMATCTELEQKYILEHNAVTNPEYLNMNGCRRSAFKSDKPMSLDFVYTANQPASDYVSKIIAEYHKANSSNTFAKTQFATQVIIMCMYGFLAHEQVDYEYNLYSRYGTQSEECIEDILNLLTGMGYIEKFSGIITMSEKFIDSIPLEVHKDNFSVTMKGIY